MKAVVTTGELLVDMVPVGASHDETCYRPVAGGAPANVAVGVRRLGRPSSFLGKVGDDPFGHRLARTLEAEGVDISGLLFDASARTGLAFVTLGADGEREFTFYRNPSADMLFRADEVDLTTVEGAGIFHFGSISLISEPSRTATLTAARAARRVGVTVSYDPNLRPALWPEEAAARAGIMSGWEHAGIVKLSEDELEFLTGGRSLQHARQLFGPALELLVVSRGPDGCSWLTADGEGDVSGVRVAPVDTTGAGDAFVAALLVSLLEQPRLFERESELREALRRANAAGALCATRPGAIPALPTAAEIEALLARH